MEPQNKADVAREALDRKMSMVLLQTLRSSAARLQHLAQSGDVGLKEAWSESRFAFAELSGALDRAWGLAEGALHSDEMETCAMESCTVAVKAYVKFLNVAEFAPAGLISPESVLQQAENAMRLLCYLAEWRLLSYQGFTQEDCDLRATIVHMWRVLPQQRNAVMFGGAFAMGLAKVLLLETAHAESLSRKEVLALVGCLHCAGSVLWLSADVSCFGCVAIHPSTNRAYVQTEGESDQPRLAGLFLEFDAIRRAMRTVLVQNPVSSNAKHRFAGMRLPDQGLWQRLCATWLDGVVYPRTVRTSVLERVTLACNVENVLEQIGRIHATGAELPGLAVEIIDKSEGGVCLSLSDAAAAANFFPGQLVLLKREGGRDRCGIVVWRRRSRANQYKSTCGVRWVKAVHRSGAVRSDKMVHVTDDATTDLIALEKYFSAPAQAATAVDFYIELEPLRSLPQAANDASVHILPLEQLVWH